MVDNVIPFPHAVPEYENPEFTVMTVEIMSNGKIHLWFSDENQTVAQFLWLHECLQSVAQSINEVRKERVDLT